MKRKEEGKKQRKCR